MKRFFIFMCISVVESRYVFINHTILDVYNNRTQILFHFDSHDASYFTNMYNSFISATYEKTHAALAHVFSLSILLLLLLLFISIEMYLQFVCWFFLHFNRSTNTRFYSISILLYFILFGLYTVQYTCTTGD